MPSPFFTLGHSPARPHFAIPTLPKGGANAGFYGQGPFFHLLTPEGAAAQFLKAVVADADQAQTFVSKTCAIDFDALRNLLTQAPPIAPLVSLKNTAFLLGNSILRLHMVEEPDRHGQWKVGGVEKE